MHSAQTEQRQEAEEKEINLQVLYGSAASEAMFDFPCEFFRLPNGTGSIPYRLESKCAVVFGDPLCPSDEMEELTSAFHKYCQEVGLNVLYLIVSEKFAKGVAAKYCKITMEACKELIFDPFDDPCNHSHRLKHRVEKAIKHGLTIHEYHPKDPEIEKAIKEIGIKWQDAIKGPHIYLGHLNFFENYTGKRWFYVKDGNEITSMIMLSRLDAHPGWLLKFLITKPGAFHETSEFLMASVLDILRKENCRFLSKGMIPADYLGEVHGMSTFSQWGIKTLYKSISFAYKFQKRKEYWLRYHPTIAPAYILFANSHIGWNECKALIKAFKTSYTAHYH